MPVCFWNSLVCHSIAAGSPAVSSSPYRSSVAITVSDGLDGFVDAVGHRADFFVQRLQIFRQAAREPRQLQLQPRERLS